MHVLEEGPVAGLASLSFFSSLVLLYVFKIFKVSGQKVSRIADQSRAVLSSTDSEGKLRSLEQKVGFN